MVTKPCCDRNVQIASCDRNFTDSTAPVPWGLLWRTARYDGLVAAAVVFIVATWSYIAIRGTEKKPRDGQNRLPV